jgi:hypothetical protein
MVAKRVINLPGMTEFVEWLRISATAERNKAALTKTLADRVICEKCGTLMDSQSNKSFLAYERMRQGRGRGNQP